MLKRGALLVIGALVGGLLLVLIAVLVLFAIQTTRVAKRIEQRNETILTAIRDNTSSLEFLRQNLALLAEDSNAARAALKLPQRQYPILSAPPPAVASQDDSDVYLTAFDTLLRQRDRLVAERRFADIAGSAPLNELVSNNGLTEDHTAADRILLRRRGRTYFTVTVRSDSGNIRVTDALGKEMLARQIDSRLSQFVAQRIAPLDAHFARLQEQIDAVNAMRSAPKVVEFTKLHALTFSHPQDNGAQYSFSVIKDGQILMTVSLDERSFAARAGDRRYGNAEELSAAFLSDLSRLDLRTPAERRVDASRKRVAALRSDKTFMSALAAKGVTFASTPRLDADYYYYDFTDADGHRIGSFAVERKVGDIYLMDGDDVPIASLRSVELVPGLLSKKKRADASSGSSAPLSVTAQSTSVSATLLPAAPRLSALVRSDPTIDTQGADSKSVENILLCGAHQAETDSIIIVHVDRAAGKIILIGVPRDLYYKGRKINAVYQLYGPGELTREVAQITGLPIERYIVIDMYAFIDVVNILGGIDLYLPEPIADPTYRIRTNGEWSTLSYSKGMHHLDGIEALRVARSRHTTSDFARVYRQQDILGAIRAKVESSRAFDVTKLYQLVQVFLRYVDTNMTPAELVGAFLADRDLPITGHYVIDTANVLYQTYTNLYYLKESGRKISTDTNLGAWIVLPKDDDWNIIRAYVRSITEGDAS